MAQMLPQLASKASGAQELQSPKQGQKEANDDEVNSQTNQVMSENSSNPENKLSSLPQENLSQQKRFDINTLVLLLKILQKVSQEKGNNAEPNDFINVLENILNNEKEDNDAVQELQK